MLLALRHLVTALPLLAVAAAFATPSATPSSPMTAVVDVPAFRPHARILFQGDSITDGNRGRNSDPNHILGHGYAFIIAAQYGAAFAERDLTFINRGISANTVADLAARWQQDTLDLQPDVLSILVGVNDLNSGVPPEVFEQRYDELLATTVKALPRIRLVLCEPFALPVGKKAAGWVEYRPQLLVRQQIVARLAKKYGAALVQLQPVLDAAVQRAPAEHWIWDGIHPTYSGHQLLADEWVRVVRARWPSGDSGQEP